MNFTFCASVFYFGASSRHSPLFCCCLALFAFPRDYNVTPFPGAGGYRAVVLQWAHLELNCACRNLCLFACSSRTDVRIFTKFGMLIPWDQEDNTGGSELREKFLEFDSRRGLFCCSGSERYRRRTRRNLFCLGEQIAGTKVTNQKTVLGVLCW